jgi:hypothetical protein
MPIEIKPKETEEEFISRCIGEEVKSGKEVDVATAICYSYWDKGKMSKIKDTPNKVMASVNYNQRFRGINLMAEAGEDPCQSGYTQYGTKDDGGREVPNCIPDSE